MDLRTTISSYHIPSHILHPLTTGTVLALPAPVRLDRMLPCEDITLQNHPYISLYFISSGSEYPLIRRNVLAESIGFEPMNRFLSDGLANRCITTLPTLQSWCPHLDSNQELTAYEAGTLTH